MILGLMWLNFLSINVSVVDGALQADTGYVTGKAPRDVAYRNALDTE